MLANTPKTLDPDLKYKQLKKQINALKDLLSKTEQNYTELYDFNPTAIISIDKKCIIKTLNFRAVIFFSSERKILINQNFLNFISTCSKLFFIEKINILLNTRINQTFNIKLKNQKEQFIQVTITARLNTNNLIHLDLYNIPLKFQGVFNQEIERSFVLINRLFEGTNEALAALDFEFNLKIMNDSFSYLFSKIIFNKISIGMNLIHSLKECPEFQSKILDACNKALEGEKIFEIIENSFANVNDYYCFELNIYSFDKVLLFRIKNITNFKIEEKLKHQWQAEIGLTCRARVKEEMASALAHEINQPLSIIATYSQTCCFLIKEKPSQELLNQLIEPINKIAIQAEIAGEIIHNLRDLRHKDDFNREKTNINTLIKDTLSLFHYELIDFKLKINLNLNKDLPIVRVNKIHIMQVLLNLARNSIEAFKSSQVTSPELSIETTLQFNDVIVHVRDNGPGIPKKYLNKILNTYFTTKSNGTGIGLSLCKTLIENHGGKLNINTTSSNGAWFSFTLPTLETKTHESI